jgi:hypothetical protein
MTIRRNSMKKTSIVLGIIFVAAAILPLFGQSVSYTNPDILKNFLPTIKGFRLGMKDLATWVQIEKDKFPIVLRTYYKNNQKVIIKIMDAHYEPLAYRDYYFYADLKEKEGGQTDRFSMIRINGENIYIHQKLKQKIVRGIGLIGNRYIVEVAVSPAEDTNLLAEVMEKINFPKLSEINNPVIFRKKDFRIKPPKSTHPDEY